MRSAAQAGAHLVVFPEMCLTGYPVEDLAFRLAFIDASRAAIEKVAHTLAEEGMGGVAAVVGYLDRAADVRAAPGIPKNAPQNRLAVLYDGRVVLTQAKHHLWNYGVGD